MRPLYWDAAIVHAVLCNLGQNVIDLALDYEKIPKYFSKYKNINMGSWSQYLWSSLLTIPQNELQDICKELEHVIIGGERCEKNAAETFYNKTGILQMTGFGASEVNTTFSITHPHCTKMGTAGIPLPFNNVKIVDESFNDVTYNVRGRLFITGPTLMLGYYNRDDLTKKAIHVDEKGRRWYDTGDYAVVDTDGCLTVIDRYMKPIEIVSNGVKESVNLLDIVEIIKTDRNIKNCKMTHVGDKTVLHLSLDDFTGLSEEEAFESILNTIKNKLEEKYWPNIIILYDELPRTSVGKVDYKKLQEDTKKIYMTKNTLPKDRLNVINCQVKNKNPNKS